MDDNKSFFVYLIVFLVLALGGMYVISNQAKPQTFYLSQEPPKNTISVNSEAKLRITPNVAQVYFNIETNDSLSAKVAQDKNADLTDKVKKALIAAGLNKEDITTIQFSVDPIKRSHWYCPPPFNGSQKTCDSYDRIYYEEIIGYKTTHSIFVKSDDTSKVGNIIDAITGAAGNSAKISSISFTLKDETKKQLGKDLLENASRNAKEKAQRIASGSGVTLGKPTNIVESFAYPIPYNYNYAIQAAQKIAGEITSQPTQIFAGEVDVTASVSVTYELN